MYTIDVVASAGFGVEGKSFTNIISPFRKLIADIAKPSSFNMIRSFVINFMPGMAPVLGIPFLPKNNDIWVRAFVEEIIKRRSEIGERRQDFLQAFMDIQKKKAENGLYTYVLLDVLPLVSLTNKFSCYLQQGTLRIYFLQWPLPLLWKEERPQVS